MVNICKLCMDKCGCNTPIHSSMHHLWLISPLFSSFWNYIFFSFGVIFTCLLLYLKWLFTTYLNRGTLGLERCHPGFWCGAWVHQWVSPSLAATVLHSLMSPGREDVAAVLLLDLGRPWAWGVQQTCIEIKYRVKVSHSLQTQYLASHQCGLWCCSMRVIGWGVLRISSKNLCFEASLDVYPVLELRALVWTRSRICTWLL
jgi:hypothetical protein